MHDAISQLQSLRQHTSSANVAVAARSCMLSPTLNQVVHNWLPQRENYRTALFCSLFRFLFRIWYFDGFGPQGNVLEFSAQDFVPRFGIPPDAREV
eukprot:4661659-Amphidinium_carterae.1